MGLIGNCENLKAQERLGRLRSVIGGLAVGIRHIFRSGPIRSVALGPFSTLGPLGTLLWPLSLSPLLLNLLGLVGLLTNTPKAYETLT